MASAKDYLKLHFIVFLWGFSAIIGKLVNINSTEMVLLRFLLAAIGMYILTHFTKHSLQISGRNFIKLMLIGVVVALHWIAFFGSARLANISVSLVGFATNSLWAALLEPWFTNTRIKKFELVLGLMVVTGLYIIFSFNFQYKVGLLLAVFAGFTSALFSVFNAKMVQHVNSRAITFYEMAGGFFGTGIAIFSYSTMRPHAPSLLAVPSVTDWLGIALLAGVCSIYAYTVSVELLKKISVFLIQLTLNLEPLYGIIMAVIIFKEKEKMSVNFYAGTFIILCAVLSYPIFKKKFEKPPVVVN